MSAYVFSVTKREQIEYWLSEFGCCVSANDGDTLLIRAETLDEAIDLKNRVEEGEGLKYKSVVLPNGHVMQLG